MIYQCISFIFNILKLEMLKYYTCFCKLHTLFSQFTMYVNFGYVSNVVSKCSYIIYIYVL